VGVNGPRPDDLLAALDALADADEVAPPVDLRDRVLAAAVAERAPGLAIDAEEAVSPFDAFLSQVEAVRSVAHSLSDADWQRPATPYPWSLHELLGHLVGVESYFGSILGLWDFDATAPQDDHIAITEAEVERQRASAPPETLAVWEGKVEAIADHLRAQGPDYLTQDVIFHTYPFSVGSALVARTFELWTHADDLRRAVDRPMEAPAPGVLREMSDLSVRNLLAATLVTAPHQSERSARVVLTGPGGGTWRLGDPDGAPDVTIVADVVDYCRMVSRRVDPEDLSADITGDRQLAMDLFDAARLLAA
jgi:uncharacterized protein (TIGR03083 family)